MKTRSGTRDDLRLDPAKLKFQSLQAGNWQDFEQLMGAKGGCGGCWCMFFRLPASDFKRNKFEGNRKMMKQIVHDGAPAGLIASLHGEPVGWMAMAPREHYVKIEKSRALKRIDEKPVWSIPCFYIKKEFRRKGLSRLMIAAAIEFARKNNVIALEAYPSIPYSQQAPGPFLWTGVLSAFIENGFKLVQTNGKTRAMVRIDC